MRIDRRRLAVLFGFLAVAVALPVAALVLGDVVEDSQLFLGPSSSAHFGAAIAILGDLDADGKSDLLVGDPGYSGGGSGRGAVRVVDVDAVDVSGPHTC